jgi:hypothetical protein
MNAHVPQGVRVAAGLSVLLLAGCGEWTEDFKAQSQCSFQDTGQVSHTRQLRGKISHPWTDHLYAVTCQKQEWLGDWDD